MAAFAAAVIWLVVKVSTGGRYKTLLKSGLPARGILLSVSSLKGTRSSSGGMTFENRKVTIDVEELGKPPYEVTCLLMIPNQLRADILPGATVELRVDKKNKNSIAVIGPGAGVIGTGMIK